MLLVLFRQFLTHKHLHKVCPQPLTVERPPPIRSRILPPKQTITWPFPSSTPSPTSSFSQKIAPHRITEAPYNTHLYPSDLETEVSFKLPHINLRAESMLTSTQELPTSSRPAPASPLPRRLPPPSHSHLPPLSPPPLPTPPKIINPATLATTLATAHPVATLTAHLPIPAGPVIVAFPA